jgi:outer membrane protein insertion porin family
MFRAVRLGICLLFGFLALGSLASAQGLGELSQRSPRITIERIDIRGNRRIQEDTIRFYIQSRPGDVYDEGKLELDLRALFNAKFFENIEVEERDGDTGKIITFIVKEKPLIRDIQYEGAKSFTESNILDEFKERKVGLTRDSSYEPAKVRAAERALKGLMEKNGKPLGTVRTEIENIPPNSVRVRFIMDEGPKVRIGQIKFIGNKVFSDRELKSALKLDKERGMITMFKGTDKYNAEKLDYDIQVNLEGLYKEHGYMQVQVGQPLTRIFEGPRGMIPMFRKTRQQFFIEIPIDAGEQFRLGTLKLENCGVLDCAKLVSAFGLKKGDVFNFKKVKDTLEQMKKMYGNYGYINWSYMADQNMDPKTKTMDLTLKMETGKQFLVNRIYFTGNTKTRDKVIRREFILEEGKFFSTQALDLSVLRVNQLGFFEKIEEKDYEVKPDEKASKVDVTVKLKEKSQQSIGLTGGVSGISGSFLGLNYTTNNFLGRGESLEFSVTGGTRTTDIMLSFTEPYFLDTRWTMGASVYNQRFRYDTYTLYGYAGLNTGGQPSELFTQKTTGTTINFSRPLRLSFWRLGTSYTYQRIGISKIAPGFETYALGQLVGFAPNNDPTAALKGIIRSEITPSLSYNTTNSYFNPTRGSSLNFSLGVSGGLLGGDFSMIRPTVEYRHFFPDKWLSGRRNTFGFRAMGQYIRAYGDSSTIPFFDRFFIGGETTIRGFDIRSISPLAVLSTPSFDSTGKNPIIDMKTGLPRISRTIQPLGGDSLAIFNGEYRIPIAGPLSVSAFYDVGWTRINKLDSLGNFGTSTVTLVDFTNNANAIRSSTGIEIQFLLPVVSAPFRLIFAYNPQVMNGTIMVGTVPFGIREPRHDIKFTIGRSF